MLNIVGRPSSLPNNSREPAIVLDGGGSNITASNHHLQYQSPIASSDLVWKSTVFEVFFKVYPANKN